MRIFYVACFISCLGGTGYPSPVLEFKAVKCWERETPNLSHYKIASDNDKIFIPLLDGEILGVTSRNEYLWKIKNEREIAGDLISDKEYLYALTKEADNALQLNRYGATTGLALKKLKLPFNNVKEWKIVGGKAVLLSSQGEIYLASADLEKAEKIGEEANGFAAVEDSVFYVGNDRRTLRQYNVIAENEKVITLSKSSAVSSKVIQAQADRQSFLISNRLGLIEKYNRSGKRIWGVRIGGDVVSLGEDSSAYVIASTDNFIYSFDKKNGNPLWKKRLEGRNGASYSKDKSYLAVSVLNDNKAYLLDGKTGTVIQRIITGDEKPLSNEPLFLDDSFILSSQGSFALYSRNCP